MIPARYPHPFIPLSGQFDVADLGECMALLRSTEVLEDLWQLAARSFVLLNAQVESVTGFFRRRTDGLSIAEAEDWGCPLSASCAHATLVLSPCQKSSQI